MSQVIKTKGRIRVGFVIGSLGSGWLGGLNYYTNLLAAIAVLRDRRIEIVLLLPVDADPALAARFCADEIVYTPLVMSNSKRRMVGVAVERLIGRNLTIEWLAWRHGIDVFSHMPPAGRRSPMRVISWIPDFQHLRLPDFFSSDEREARDRTYGALVAGATIVVLSSHDARSDLLARYPQAVNRARVLQFVSGLGYDGAQCSREVLAEKYALDAPWFHLPNQLWKHKNHRVVVDALSLLLREGLAPLVITTGATQDFRHPGFLEEIRAYATAQGVADNFRILGLVPYQDVTALMHYAIAVINPSMFEGWSTTVEEAKSTGKRIILSDIPVHREQAPSRGTFFPPDNPDALATAIKQSLADFNSDTERQAAADAAAILPGRLQGFAQTYQNIVIDATRC